jgi:hypothetical protein
MVIPVSSPFQSASVRHLPNRDALPGQPLGHALLKNRGRAVHAAGTLALDRWQGEERVQLRLIDLAAADPVGRV